MWQVDAIAIAIAGMVDEASHNVTHSGPGRLAGSLPDQAVSTSHVSD
jgi:hypothetical protein